MKPVARVAAIVAVVSLAGAGCGLPDDAKSEDNRLVVFAAASLKESFTDIGEQFKTDNPGSDIEFSFAGSSDLVTQLTQGAPADVFASADTKNMDKAANGGPARRGSGELRDQHVDDRHGAG